MSFIPVVGRMYFETGQNKIYLQVSLFLRVAGKQQIYILLNGATGLFKQTNQPKLNTTAEAIIILMFLCNIKSIAFMILS